MKQNIMYIGIVLATGLLFSQASYATDYGNYDHAQGNQYQCATSPTTETQCEIENILKDFFPKMLDQLTQINGNLQTEIANQNTIITNQNTEISLLKQLVPAYQEPTVQGLDGMKNCHKSGTGILCG